MALRLMCLFICNHVHLGSSISCKQQVGGIHLYGSAWTNDSRLSFFLSPSSSCVAITIPLRSIAHREAIFQLEQAISFLSVSNNTNFLYVQLHLLNTVESTGQHPVELTGRDLTAATQERVLHSWGLLNVHSH
jgi:hypothetical protein